MADQYHQHASYGAQQRLPPFREVRCLNAGVDSLLTSQLLTPNSTEQAATNGYQNGRAPTSPTQVRPSPMPGLAQGFDGPARYPDQPYSGQRDFNYAMGNGVSHYPEIPSQYPGQAPGTPTFDPYSSAAGISPMDANRERMMRPSPQGAQFVSNGANYPGMPDSDSQFYQKRPIYDQTPRGQTSYPTQVASRTPDSAEFAGYRQQGYDASGRPYSGMYGDVDYSPSATNGAQQGYGMLGESSGNKKRRGNLPKQVTDILRAWFLDHLDHPYPTEEDKQMFIARTGLTISQVRGMQYLYV